MVAGLALALLQASAWSVAPVQPTVGDTIRLERRIPASPGWRVRATKLDLLPLIEPLADPAVLRAEGGWVVRYAVVGWEPGAYRHAMPPLMLLGPDGQVDSLPGDTAIFALRSVMGDSAAAAVAQPALLPLRPEHRDPLPVSLSLAAALGALFAGLSWRQRRPRRVELLLHVPVEPEVPDERWVAAGEPRAVAARTAGRLRAELARAIPAAHAALSTAECLAALERERPDAPLRDLETVLLALDQIGFATAHGRDVGELAGRARALAREFST